MPHSSAYATELLRRCTFPAPGTSVVAAVSGGADSLALLVLAVAAGLDVEAVHVDHCLRPGSADEASVVAAAAERFGAGFRAETVGVDDGPDLESRARRARRAVLGDAAMTGHTADDQAETLLINLIRGAGVDGLAAMQPGERHPILALRRAETVQLCAELGLTPIVDSSNQDPRFVRNRVRHELLPLMSEISDRDVVPLVARTADLARSAADVVDAAAAALDPTDTAALQAVSPPLASAALRRWLETDDGYRLSSAEVERVMAVVRHEAVACQLSRGRTIRRRHGRLSLTVSVAASPTPDLTPDPPAPSPTPETGG